MDDLYGLVNIGCFNGTCGVISYRYWNNNFAGDTGDNLFDSTHMPAENYLTRADLESAYGASNFTNTPIYVRSVLIDGNIVGHQVCLWYNNREICIQNGYWAGTLNTPSSVAGTQTQIKIKRDMQDALGITIQDSNCYSGAGNAGCFAGNNNLFTYNTDNIGCCASSCSIGCFIDASGSAHCDHE